MINETEILRKYLNKHNIDDLEHGKQEDKLGDMFEEYCCEIFNSKELLEHFLDRSKPIVNYEKFDFEIFESLINCFEISSKILSISATNNIKSRETGGYSKTDILVSIMVLKGEKIQIPVSIKHTSVNKVALAEFDVETIIQEVGIEDAQVKSLMLKHQCDGSAKNFNAYEKQILNEKLKPYVKKFVTWIVSGTALHSKDIRFPKYFIKFKIKKYIRKPLEIETFNCYPIEDYINLIIFDKNLKYKKGGFGTGLSWTYATKSKGNKIQFKG